MLAPQSGPFKFLNLITQEQDNPFSEDPIAPTQDGAQDGAIDSPFQEDPFQEEGGQEVIQDPPVSAEPQADPFQEEPDNESPFAESDGSDTKEGSDTKDGSAMKADGSDTKEGSDTKDGSDTKEEGSEAKEEGAMVHETTSIPVPAKAPVAPPEPGLFSSWWPLALMVLIPLLLCFIAYRWFTGRRKKNAEYEAIYETMAAEKAADIPLDSSLAEAVPEVDLEAARAAASINDDIEDVMDDSGEFDIDSLDDDIVSTTDDAEVVEVAGAAAELDDDQDSFEFDPTDDSGEFSFNEDDQEAAVAGIADDLDADLESAVDVPFSEQPTLESDLDDSGEFDFDISEDDEIGAEEAEVPAVVPVDEIEDDSFSLEEPVEPIVAEAEEAAVEAELGSGEFNLDDSGEFNLEDSDEFSLEDSGEISLEDSGEVVLEGPAETVPEIVEAEEPVAEIEELIEEPSEEVAADIPEVVTDIDDSGEFDFSADEEVDLDDPVAPAAGTGLEDVAEVAEEAVSAVTEESESIIPSIAGAGALAGGAAALAASVFGGSSDKTAENVVGSPDPKLEAEVKELREEIAALRRERDSVKGEYEGKTAGLNDELASLRQARDAAEKERDAAKVDFSSQATELADLKSQLVAANNDNEASAKSEIDELKSRLEAVDTEATQLKDEKSKLQEQLDKSEETAAKLEGLRKDLDEAAADLAEAEKAKEELSGELAAAQQELEKTKEAAVDPAELAVANEKHADLESQLEQAEEQRSTVAGKLSALRKEVRERDAAEEAIQAETIKLHEEFESLQAKLQEAEESHSAELEELRSQVSANSTDVAAADPEELAEARAAVEEANKAAEEANKATGVAEAESKEAAIKLGALQNELDRVKAQMADMDLSDDLKAAEVRIKELEGENNGFRTAMSSNDSSAVIGSLQQEITGLKTQLADKLGEINANTKTDHAAALKVDLEQLKSQFALVSEQQSGKLDSRLSQLVEQVSKSNETQQAAIAETKEISRLQQALDKSVTENQQLQIEVGKAQSQTELIEQLKGQLADERTQKAEFARSVEENRAALKVAESKLLEATTSQAKADVVSKELMQLRSEMAEAKNSRSGADVSGELKILRTELAAIKTMPSNNGDSMKALLQENRNLNAQIVELSKTMASLAARPVAAPTVKKSKAVPKTKAASKAKTAKKRVPDDLKKIEGIGPKIKGVLGKQGITTFAELSKTKLSDLRSILADAKMSSHDPSTWKKQASLANKGDWDALKQLQDELNGGVMKKK